MNYRTTLWLFVTVCLLGGALWVLQRNVSPTDRRRDHETQVLNIDLLHANALVVQNADARIEVQRRGDMWHIVRPIDARADEAVISRLLSTCEALTCAETITREQREHRALSLGDYGLDLARYSVTFRTPLGKQRLLIGNDAHLGKRTYVRIDGESDVLVVNGDLVEALPASLEAMRDRVLWRGQPTRVTRLEIERPESGFVQLLRDSGGWTIQQPMRDPADTIAVDALLDALFAARIESFVWDPPAGVTTVAADALEVVRAAAPPVESYGLADDTASVRIRLWQTGDDVGRELTLGKEAVEEGEGRVYAMVADSGAIFTLDDALLEKCRISVNDLRSRMLVRLDPQRIRYLAVQQGDQKLTVAYRPESGWSIIEPIQWAADRETVGDAVRRLTSAKIEAFLDTSTADERPERSANTRVLHVTLDTRYPVSTDSTESNANAEGDTSITDVGRCVLTAMAYGTNNQMEVTVTGRDGRFLVKPEALLTLPDEATLPLAFYDRTMLAVPPRHVRRFVLQRGEAGQSIERDAEGQWVTAEAEPGKPDPAVLSDLLYCASNLRAVRVADSHPSDLTAYGLATPEASLTVGLTGGDAIQKTILIGAAAGPSERYAMIQGQDVVFVMNQGLVERLLRDLVVTDDDVDAK